MPADPQATSLHRVALVCLLAAASLQAFAQVIPRGDDRQRLPGELDTVAARPQVQRTRPDTILLRRYDPTFPVAFAPVTDSLLDLAYVRYDPVRAYGPDYTYLNSLGQPATLNPVVGTEYTRFRRTNQRQHPAYEANAAPFFDLNLPFSYTAYDQGGEIDDGQVQVLFGRNFARGWRIGAEYRRIYQGGAQNVYAESRAERIALGATVAHVPDSSRHRTYLSTRLNWEGYANSGGYLYALEPDGAPTLSNTPSEVNARLTGVRSEGSRSGYRALHRVFLREQLDSVAGGWAASAALDYERTRQRHTARVPTGNGEDSVRFAQAFGDLVVDDRGLRYAYTESGATAEAALEYFVDPRRAARFGFNFRAGVYGGFQNFAFEGQSEGRQVLAGLMGRVSGRVFGDFTLEADTDLALGDRAGEGRINGSLGWTYRDRFALAAEARFERSAVPLGTGALVVNGLTVASVDLPASTHTRLGGSARWLGGGEALPWLEGGLAARAYLDAYLDAHIYGADRLPRGSSDLPPIPTLEVDAPLRFGIVVLDNRLTLRNAPASADVYLPAYTGQHAVYLDLLLFQRRMNLLVGLDARVRTASRLYDYAPLPGVFFVRDDAQQTGLRYAADAFVTLKVQSFKAFIRFDNLLVNDAADPPATVDKYPVVRGGLTRSYVRFGVSFFLLN